MIPIKETPFGLTVAFPTGAQRFADTFGRVWNRRLADDDRQTLIRHWTRFGGPSIQYLPTRMLPVLDDNPFVGITSGDGRTLCFDGEIACHMPVSTTLQTLIAYQLVAALLIVEGRPVQEPEVEDRLRTMGLSVRSVRKWLQVNA